MTATATPVPQAVKEWTRIFPKEMTQNYTSSVTFMKQLTVVAVSTITYLKNAFPEDSYTVESFGGIKLRILKSKCRDELAQFLSTALTQAFEAFDKKYLHQLALCFYEDECKLDNLIEYHVFEYTYKDDGVTMSVHSKNRDSSQQTAKYTFENVKERTLQMIRACVVIMQSCQNELPSTYDVSLRLYYNEDAPLDYQAPGFLCTNESEDHLEPTLRESIKLGCVATPYHRLVARTFIRDAMAASREANPSQNIPMITQNEEEELSLGSGQISGNETGIVCPCNKYDGYEDYSSSELLTCQYCNTKQHAACYGLLREHGPPAPHGCAACHDSDNTRHATDPKLIALNSKKRECLCIFRRTLEWCSQVSRIQGETLATRFGLSRPNATKLMKLLHSHGIIQDPVTDLKTSQAIVSEQLNVVMSKFFQTSRADLVESFLAEAISQGTPDPIAEVLSPMEKVSLQNASQFARIAEPLMEITNEDATLKQYHEAILSNAMEECPMNEDPMKSLPKRSNKRKINREEDRPILRSGVKTKRARAMPK